MRTSTADADSQLDYARAKAKVIVGLQNGWRINKVSRVLHSHVYCMHRDGFGLEGSPRAPTSGGNSLLLTRKDIE
jgi:hypothetical protein